MNARTQITMDVALTRRARARAAELGISFAEYVRRIVSRDLGEPNARQDPSILFDLIDDGVPTDIGRDKDRMVGEAVWQEHLRKTRQRSVGNKREASRKSARQR